ncbi:MAG: hypothetical protein IK016_03745 [Lachnospiraceae bacterium]|nr:hypothetical protein [Lachnospiraceae bacterium]
MNRIGQEVLTTLTGNLPKAVLCVRDINKTGALDLTQTQKDAQDLQKEFLKQADARLKNPLTAAQDSYKTIEKGAGGKGYVPMQVQYNPASIQLESMGGPMESDLNMGMQSVQNIYEMSVPPTATLSMQLIFDEVNVFDAFGLEGATLSAGGAVSTVTGLAVNYSVKKQCDGLLACMMSLPTRQVIFYWTNMVFRGTLLSVDVNYQMFNRQGNPVRATVDLAIQQQIRSQDEEKEFEPYWKEAFDRAFGKAGVVGDVSGGTSMLSKATNNSLLNLNI